MDRPLISLTIVDLTRMVDDPSSTADVGLVAAELRYRKSNAAKKLLARLDVAGPSRVTTAADERVGSGLADDSTSQPTLEGKARPLGSDVRLSILRETYTEGAEILARWGMTTAIPDELFDLAVEWWRGCLGDAPDGFGRTVERLDEDVARVRSLGAIGGVDV